MITNGITSAKNPSIKLRSKFFTPQNFFFSPNPLCAQMMLTITIMQSAMTMPGNSPARKSAATEQFMTDA